MSSARERSEAADRSAQQRRRGARPRSQRVREQQRADHGHTGDRLRHDQPVVHPEVRIQRGQQRREQPDPIASDPAPEQTDERDEHRAEQRHEVALLREMGRIVDPRERTVDRQPRHRSENQNRQRRMIRGRRRVRTGDRPLDEAIALREAVGLAVVEELIADRALGGERTDQRVVTRSVLGARDVSDANDERDGDDGEQQPSEAQGGTQLRAPTRR